MQVPPTTSGWQSKIRRVWGHIPQFLVSSLQQSQWRWRPRRLQLYLPSQSLFSGLGWQLLQTPALKRLHPMSCEDARDRKLAQVSRTSRPSLPLLVLILRLIQLQIRREDSTRGTRYTRLTRSVLAPSPTSWLSWLITFLKAWLLSLAAIYSLSR
jgi:hypothetical protein